MNTLTAEVTFEVTKVKPHTPVTLLPYHEAVAKFVGGPLESCSRYHGKLVDIGPFNPLMSALHLAFQNHYPIRLSPDMIWLTLCQGLAFHINANAEELRRHFVKHEGQLEIIVRRDEFIKGSPENDWPGVFAEFSHEIKQHIGDTHNLIVADFSTTGPVERAASEIALMDAMQAYFRYTVYTACGIPAITLEGNAEDWHAIVRRVQKFSRYGLSWWVEPLLPILSEFENAVRGEVKHDFWSSIYRHHSMSGGGYTSGWSKCLFPYLTKGLGKDGRLLLVRNTSLQSPLSEEGPGLSAFPKQLSKAPFLWNYFAIEYHMEFMGGILGVAQEPEALYLRPEVGWVVREMPIRNKQQISTNEVS